MNRFFRFVEAVFQFRRKQLGGALGRLIRSTSEEAASMLAGAGIDAARRPQTLGLAEWEAVYRAFNLRFDR
jgi:16S rRNA A1518/A1519 N6-dimethyltransferase RsmA/KsgA/DIM1 with predicted DNA glycosylase/AP lyase activity